MRRYSVPVAGLVLLGLPVSSAVAYQFNETDNGTPREWVAGAVAMSINTHHWAEGSATHEAIEDAVEAWDSIPGSSFGATHGNYNEATLGYSNSNNINQITFWDDLGSCNPETTAEIQLGATDLRYDRLDRWKIKEADVLLNAFCPSWDATIEYFDVNDARIQAAEFNPQIAVLHEMGHVVGLDHEDGNWDIEATYDSGCNCYIMSLVDGDGWPATMFAEYSGIGAAIADDGIWDRRYGVNEDDREGLRALYPDTGSARDVAVASYHTPDEDSLDVYWSSCASEVLYKARPDPRKDLTTCPANDSTSPVITSLNVTRPASLTTTFSVLNLGNTNESSISYRYVLRSSPTTTAGQQVLSSGTLSANPNVPYERAATVAIGTGVPTGTWYLVMEVDYTDSLVEVDEYNNIAVWSRRLNVQ